MVDYEVRMYRLDEEDRKALKKVLDIKHYEKDTFDPKILDQMETNDEYKQALCEHAGDILASEQFLRLKEFIQHGVGCNRIARTTKISIFNDLEVRSEASRLTTFRPFLQTTLI